MARPHSHQEALSESLQASGGLGQFRAVAERTREVRDGPFGPPPERPASEPPKPIPKSAPALATAPTPKVEQRIPATPPSKQPAPAQALAESVAPDAEENLFTENVTVPLSRSLRDRSEELAKLLNRNRTIRKSRITRNTVIRVALESFLETFRPTSSESVNSEAELLKAALSARRK